MPKKALDSRIPALIKNGVQERKRSFFVIVGDKGRDQIVNLHWLLAQSQVAARPSVLWCYKKDLLGFTSHRKKREKKIKKEVKRGIREANTEDPFELFVSVTNIRYVYYKESEKILGNTFGMCVLQDFEALTPNLLARTVETVEGGGIVVILLKTMSSLKQLYTMTMDIHSRYRTEAHDDVVARFNERFILSLGSCDACLVVDDELNVLPISGGRNVSALPQIVDSKALEPAQIELNELKSSLADTQPIGSLVSAAKTVDQAKALLTFVDAIVEKTLRSTVSLTAARGRGKSAALGLAIAAAIAHGYSNIFITSPSPENLKTLFEFIFKGFDALKYDEHLDYDIIQSINPSFNKAIVRVNIFRNHRQTIQYIQPQDAHVLGQAELVIIDEAAAIPLPLIRKLIGPYLVFMASTINGYEGTGRSLSLKLMQQLREQSRGFIGKSSRDTSASTVDRFGKETKSHIATKVGNRTLREITLDEPIRYAKGDEIEKWLNKVLCLEVSGLTSRYTTQGCPHPSECNLFYVNRDTLFSFHPVSEAFMQRMMALYVASHYKNSPNDLQLMSDAPAHMLFVLLPPIAEDDTRLPEPLCVLQLALEGDISKQTVLNSLQRGHRAGGDMIPWLVAQQFQDEEFAGLSGARVVRIATHPDYVKMGYGSRAIQLLEDYYTGKFTNLSESENLPNLEIPRITDQEINESTLLSDTVKVRDPKTMPPLLLKLSERRPDNLEYLGVSYGLTAQLHKFWKRNKFVPIYLRQTPNDLTGEHSCVMLKVLEGRENAWLGAFSKDFHKRFSQLLSFSFRNFTSVLSLSIMQAADFGATSRQEPNPLTKSELDAMLSPFDLKRLESYANNMLDYHVILDLVPLIANLYFSGRLATSVKLSGVQSSILLSIGLQRKSIDDVVKELDLGSTQVLAIFVKAIKKTANHFRDLLSKAIEETMTSNGESLVRKGTDVIVRDDDDQEMVKGFNPTFQTLEEDLEQGGEEVMTELREKQKELINSLNLEKYAINGDSENWDDADNQIKGSLGSGNKSTVVSVKKKDSSMKRKTGETAAGLIEKEERASKKPKRRSKK
ncbi:RNA cytidine acetyltransferase [Neolecta irregularis DAH-3]|uniref:RNA cytidine acetyltransferase n=1 Tax=Neolecta irregularis (strain DAH-3) TaxID=1198029 RepID=A0A1U7LSB4_NEOID|nr:RNA cytidine acetyltransferase [Neolecta irregularis DAH-3]|eukprot:OLL25473.1 RNA cytidine acetyltransferase [Neolecta irregularis DAH-3]